MTVFDQETVTPASVTAGRIAADGVAGTASEAALSHLSLAALRRLLATRLDRHELEAVWYDVLGQRMSDIMGMQDKSVCVMELLQRAINRDRLQGLITNICHERPDLAGPQ